MMFKKRISHKKTSPSTTNRGVLKRIQLGIERRLLEASIKRKNKRNRMSTAFPSYPIIMSATTTCPSKLSSNITDNNTGAFPQLPPTTTKTLTNTSSLLAYHPTDLSRLPHPTLRQTFQCSLRYNRRDDDLANKNSNKKKVLQFQEQVTITEIPSYRDYDLTTRKQMYNSTKTIKSNAYRNSIEMKADGGPNEWRSFCEEDQFIQYNQCYWIHPATYKRIIVQQEKQQQRQQHCQQLQQRRRRRYQYLPPQQ